MSATDMAAVTNSLATAPDVVASSAEIIAARQRLGPQQAEIMVTAAKVVPAAAHVGTGANKRASETSALATEWTSSTERLSR